MDHLTMIVMECMGVGAWVHAMRRKETPFVWKVAAPVGIIILTVCVLLETLRTRGVWIGGAAEGSYVIIITAGLAFTAATGGLDHHKRERAR